MNAQFLKRIEECVDRLISSMITLETAQIHADIDGFDEDPALEARWQRLYEHYNRLESRRMQLTLRLGGYI